MSDIRQKATALLNEVLTERGRDGFSLSISRQADMGEALCRAIERHEATKQEYSDFRQEVSDAVGWFNKRWAILPQEDWEALLRFIIPAPKPDPLVVLCDHIWLTEDMANDLRAAMDALGFEIKEKG